MSRFVVVVVDGFGIGAMEDTAVTRKEDVQANTFKSILHAFPNALLPTFEKLGLMNAANLSSKHMKANKKANYGKMKLMHHGADSFLGHQEIMGTIPKKPIDQCIQDSIDEIERALVAKKYEVQRVGKPGLQYLLVDGLVTVSDNIDSDLGQAINVIAPLDYIEFDSVLTIGKIVRSHVHCNRVIVFGGTGNCIDDILKAEDIKENRYIGNVAVKTRSYEQGYKVIHLGYGIDETVQAPTILGQNNIPVILLGKVADIVANAYGKSVSCVDTTEVMDLTIEAIKEHKQAFICTNVQETDLAGHSMKTDWYLNLLEIVDEKLARVIDLLVEGDILCVIADHGNDPEIGHNRHTREEVPLLVYKKGVSGVCLHTRETLSDIGASVCDFFNTKPCQNGTSFIKELDTQKK